MKRLVTYILVIFATLSSTAQNNKWGISDRLADLYKSVLKHQKDTLFAVYIDSMLSEALIEKDHQAECMALKQKIRLIEQRNEVQKSFDMCDSLSAKMRKYGFISQSYEIDMHAAQYASNKNDIVHALLMISKMEKNLEVDHLPFGYYVYHKVIGIINMSRFNYNTAVVEYKRALEYLKKDEDGILSAGYFQIANTLYASSHHSEAMAYADSCLLYKDEMSIYCYNAYVCKTLIHFYQHDFEAYKKTYAEMKQYREELRKKSLNLKEEWHWTMFNLFVDGEEEKAIEIAKKVKSKANRVDVLRTFYDFAGQHELSYMYCDSLIKCLIVQFGDNSEMDNIAFNAALDRAALERESQELQLDRDRLAIKRRELERNKNNLMLENTDLELARTKDEMEAKSAILLNATLDMKNNNLEVLKKNLGLERQQAFIDDDQLQIKHRIIVQIITALGFIVLAIGVIILVVQRNIAIAKIRRSNVEIEKARHNADELRKKAERSERMKTLFMQNMSHDIRTPLNAICGFSQLITDPEISKGMDAAQKKQFADMVVNNTDMLTTLVNDILNVSELESGKYKMQYQSTRVNDICRLALKAVLYRKKAGVDMTFETNIPNDYEMYTDPLRVQQVLINFLTNAIKHTASGEICLQCLIDEHSKFIIFAVKDTGEGIPVDKAEQIFGRFEKLDSSKQATGLGLSICRLIAKHLNGKVYLDTHYIGGARFIFRHPIKQDDKGITYDYT